MTCKAKKKSNGKKGKKAKAYWQYEVDGIPQWINTPAQQWKSIQGHFDAQCPSYRKFCRHLSSFFLCILFCFVKRHRVFSSSLLMRSVHNRLHGL